MGWCLEDAVRKYYIKETVVEHISIALFVDKYYNYDDTQYNNAFHEYK
ncbi:MAG: hypothetical protein IJE43_02950 [Alphaproteobacteria bacterium]|nr:hypothetical protein [Alphaproteobacteria bacterium]MBQ6886277.1 hypothetical protein [Lachnospiraceae bacterium]